MLFSGLLAIQRAFAVEAADGNRDALRLSGLDPAGIYLGKMAAIAAQLLVLEVLLLARRGRALRQPTARAGRCWSAPAWPRPLGIAAAGTLYGVLAAGLRVRETLLPLLLLPVLAPVLIGSTRAFEAALDGTPARAGRGSGCSPCSPSLYTVFGVFGFGPLLEES